MNAVKVFFGVLAGVAAGATLGVLFAPDRGSSTRNKISKKGNGYMDDLGEKFNDLVDSFTTKFKKLKEEAVLMSENGKVKAEEIQGKVASAAKREPYPVK